MRLYLDVNGWRIGAWPGPKAVRFAPYSDREIAMLREFAEIEHLLAEALGYPCDEEYGWVTGDHTPVTLAMEVKGRGVREAG